jgi:hypothetical protein
MGYHYKQQQKDCHLWWILYNNIILLNDKHLTYQSPATAGTTSTIDLTLVTAELSTTIPTWKIGKDLSSDHFPITKSLTLDSTVTPNTILQTKWKIEDANLNCYSNELKNQISTINPINLDTTMKPINTAAETRIPKRSDSYKANPVKTVMALVSWWIPVKPGYKCQDAL